MKKSTWTIIAGVGLLFLPVPPILSAIAGLITIAAGTAMRAKGD